MKDILNSHPVGVLKKEISKTNIKGYSKLKKAELVSLMVKHKARFSHIKMADKKAPAKPVASKPVASKPKPKSPAKPVASKPVDNLQKAIGINRGQANKMDFGKLMKHLPQDIRRNIGQQVKKDKEYLPPNYHHLEIYGDRPEYIFKRKQGKFFTYFRADGTPVNAYGEDMNSADYKERKLNKEVNRMDIYKGKNVDEYSYDSIPKIKNKKKISVVKSKNTPEQVKAIKLEKEYKGKEITITGKAAGGVDDHYINDIGQVREIKIVDVYDGGVDINFGDNSAGHDLIGQALFKDIKKTKKGFTIPAKKITNRDTSYWEGSGM